MTNPRHRLVDFFEQARRASDPCATFVTLVTLDHGGTLASRIITVREVTGNGLIASISAASPKVAQLVADRWELLCFWPSCWLSADFEAARVSNTMKRPLQVGARDPNRVGSSTRTMHARSGRVRQLSREKRCWKKLMR
jgi:hypothetical protein